MSKNSETPRKQYTFFSYGHPNILANHVKTIEFTKESELSERGDCIIGVSSTFELEKLKEFNKKIKLLVEVEDPDSNELLRSEFKAIVNKNFNSDEELVLRKSHFDSERTFAKNLNRGANHLDRRIVEILREHPETRIKVTIIEGWY